MTKRRRTYSFAFKQEVVAAIQAGQLTVAEARRQYGINGAMTIQKWIQKAEGSLMRAKSNNDPSSSSSNKWDKEKQQMESAIAQLHLENLVLKKKIEIIQRDYTLPSNAKKK